MQPYPLIESYEHGFHDVGDGNSIYWETCRNPTSGTRDGSRKARSCATRICSTEFRAF